MSRPKNVLWIMCDQLRFDYLGCTGHPTLKTPNIDAMARRGVRFSNAYVQSPICGPSRMSFYTGRYMRSHGSHWNGWPLRVGEPTLGDHLKKIGVRNVLVGKTHMAPDLEGMKMLGIAPDSIIGVHVSECGFEPYERDDGLHPSGRPRPKYDAYLRERGYEAPNPWEHWANSGAADDGALQNGWLLVHADKAARVAEEDSETPYMTRRAMDFIAEAETDGRPWCLHLSYIKPHWPYIAPEPYASMYGPGDVLPAVRSEQEKQSAHPVFAAYMDMRYSRNMARDEAREKVIPTYMGLIKQIDDQMGVLMQFLEARGLLDTTMIVFTSDHGDYLGDHWMGEKDLFHDPSAKIPLIVIDPSASADRTRGTVCDALVEAIDLAPTFIEYFGGKPPDHILEGRSLMPLLHGRDAGRLAQGRILGIRLLHAGRPAQARPADRAMPAVHGVRRALEIHSRFRLPADALRPCRRPLRIDRPRRRSRLRRRHRPAAIGPVRMGATSKGPYHHQHREDRRLRREAAPGQRRNPDRDLGRGRVVRDPQEDRHRGNQ